MKQKPFVIGKFPKGFKGTYLETRRVVLPYDFEWYLKYNIPPNVAMSPLDEQEINIINLDDNGPNFTSPPFPYNVDSSGDFPLQWPSGNSGGSFRTS